MLEFKKKTKPLSKTDSRTVSFVLDDDVIAARKKEIQEILMLMEVGCCVELRIDNPNSWYVSFKGAQERLGQGNKKFSRTKGDSEGKQKDTNIYTVWRVK